MLQMPKNITKVNKLLLRLLPIHCTQLQLVHLIKRSCCEALGTITLGYEKARGHGYTQPLL